MSRASLIAPIGFALCLVVAPVSAKDDTKDVKGFAGTVKAVDVVKGTIILTVDGKDRIFLVAKDTKIVGPRGGISKDRLKDDRLVKGAKIRIVPGTDGKTAKEIHLGYRPKKPTADK